MRAEKGVEFMPDEGLSLRQRQRLQDPSVGFGVDSYVFALPASMAAVGKAGGAKS